jgi:hypothetical protein
LGEGWGEGRPPLTLSPPSPKGEGDFCQPSPKGEGALHRIIPVCARRFAAMEADRLNAIENSLHDLAARAAELRRYL